MQFTLTINCDGAAFTRVTNDDDNGMSDAAPEVARLLHKLGDRLQRTTVPVVDGDEWPLLDINGAIVGTASFSETDRIVVDPREI